MVRQCYLKSANIESTIPKLFAIYSNSSHYFMIVHFIAVQFPQVCKSSNTKEKSTLKKSDSKKSFKSSISRKNKLSWKGNSNNPKIETTKPYRFRRPKHKTKVSIVFLIVHIPQHISGQ